MYGCGAGPFADAMQTWKTEVYVLLHFILFILLYKKFIHFLYPFISFHKFSIKFQLFVGLFDIFIILMGNETISLGMNIANDIRINCNLSVVTETLQRSIRSQMREANRLNAKYCIIIGGNELASQTFTVKNMIDGTQTDIHKDKIINYFMQK